MGVIEDHIKTIFKIPKDTELSRETVFVFRSQRYEGEKCEEFTAAQLIGLIDSFEFANIFTANTGSAGRVEIEGISAQEFVYLFKYIYKHRDVWSPQNLVLSGPSSVIKTKGITFDENLLLERIEVLELTEEHEKMYANQLANDRPVNEIQLSQKAKLLHHLVNVSKIFEEIAIGDKDKEKIVKRNNELIHFLLTLPASSPKVKENGSFETVKNLSLKNELYRRAIDANTDQSVKTVQSVLGPFIESSASMIERVFASFSCVEDTISLRIEGFKAFCAQKESRASETVHIAGLPWCLQCTAVPLSDPTGKISYGSAFHLHLLRQRSDLAVNCKTQLVFRLQNQAADSDFVRSIASANFNGTEDGFGFAFFVYSSEIHGQPGFVKNDAIIFEVSVQVKEMTPSS